MKILVVDDDRYFMNQISPFIIQNFDTNSVDFIFQDYDTIFNKEYTICFIDVYLNKQDGIELARKYKNVYPNSCIVFVSNEDGIIYNAQSIDMFYFIRKAYLKDDFYDFLNKFIMIYGHIQKEIEVVKDRKRVSIPIGSIIYIEASKHSNYIYTKNQEYRMRGSLTALYNELNQDIFCQINNHEIVNMLFVETIVDLNVIMRNDLRFTISRRRRKEVIQCYFHLHSLM